MSKGYMYILQCNDGSYYTGSAKDLDKRFSQHQMGEGANYTKTRLPVELLYSEEYNRIDEVFYREKQVQGWSRRKKEVLINRGYEELPDLAKKVFAKSKVASIQSSDDDHLATAL